MPRSRRRRSRSINPHANAQRTWLRLLGIILTVTGGIFLLIGIGSFFGAMNQGIGSGLLSGANQGPDKFWCAFVGMPLLGIGITLLRLGFMGKAARYVAGEIAPVATDTFNYVASEARDGVRDLVGAATAGMRDAGQAESNSATVTCAACHHANDHDARFCDMCGAAMPSPPTCRKCSKVNDHDARFCSGCGASLC